ncbi:MAG: hypothetical protein A3J63_01900 [Candidatus Moranbacteria bacterium RIFCSPHIGHO2_02_FULL_40_12b]|nr:MAG: hypothetical protein A3J63_01900 [Candidatus Moranbacteria bacterium RIFCSPHIGHO2_02_FULL_40_12b]OGI23383.1 MAG: hypothetical protein A3E91_02405 [Candidatus Moranbacteria bacterium RIFCSPHIGHO2_12_FULL_40_10]
MKLLKGKLIAEKILNNLKLEIKRRGIKPGLAVVLIGDDKASRIYVNLKKKAARKVGVGFYIFKFGDKAEENKIIKKIKDLNADKKISGIIVQFPLPKKFNTQKIINAIDLKKDADGFSAKGGGKISPVFPAAIVKLINQAFPKVQPSEFLRLNLRSVIIANSEIFGRTIKSMLEEKNIAAEYFLYKNIKKNIIKIKNADIIVSAIGIPKLIKGDMIKKGAIIIDGGITKKGKKVLGDADYKSVKNTAGWLSPVPGGVGPVTVACLLENVYILSKKKI